MLLNGKTYLTYQENIIAKIYKRLFIRWCMWSFIRCRQNP